MNKEFIDLILQRKSVRNYVAGAAVSRENLEAICRAGLAAPSACNQQMRELVVLDERAVLDELLEYLPNAKFLKEAAAAIVVCGITDNQYSLYWQQDCSATVENMLLAIEACGLGACWCGLFPREERAQNVARVLRTPANLMPMALITIGVPVQGKDHAKDKWNPSKIHWGKF